MTLSPRTPGLQTLREEILAYVQDGSENTEAQTDNLEEQLRRSLGAVAKRPLLDEVDLLLSRGIHRRASRGLVAAVSDVLRGRSEQQRPLQVMLRRRREKAGRTLQSMLDSVHPGEEVQIDVGDLRSLETGATPIRSFPQAVLVAWAQCLDINREEFEEGARISLARDREFVEDLVAAADGEGAGRDAEMVESALASLMLEFDRQAKDEPGD